MNKQALAVLTFIGAAAVFFWMRSALKGVPSDVQAVSRERGVSPVSSFATRAGAAPADPLLSVLMASGYGTFGRPASLQVQSAGGDVLQPYAAPIIARAAYTAPIRVDYTPSSQSEFYG